MLQCNMMIWQPCSFHRIDSIRVKLYVSPQKNQNERPKTRDVLNTIYFFALPNAPKFTRNSFENFERFDSWLIQLYVKVQGAKTTAEEIIKCFLQNLEYEDVRGVINTSLTSKYWMIHRIWVEILAIHILSLRAFITLCILRKKSFNYSKAFVVEFIAI